MPQPDRPKWHALLATQERAPGVWQLVDDNGRQYGLVTIMLRGGELGYHAQVLPKDAPDGAPMTTVGYFRTLRASCERVHQAFLASHASRGPIGWSAPPQAPGNTNAPPATRR